MPPPPLLLRLRLLIDSSSRIIINSVRKRDAYTLTHSRTETKTKWNEMPIDQPSLYLVRSLVRSPQLPIVCEPTEDLLPFLPVLLLLILLCRCWCTLLFLLLLFVLELQSVEDRSNVDCCTVITTHRTTTCSRKQELTTKREHLELYSRH